MIRLRKITGKETETIAVTIRFFTTDLKSRPKTAWADNGYLQMPANPKHGIRSGKPLFFKTLDALNVTLEKLLKQRGVTLVDKNEQPRLGASY